SQNSINDINDFTSKNFHNQKSFASNFLATKSLTLISTLKTEPSFNTIDKFFCSFPNLISLKFVSSSLLTKYGLNLNQLNDLFKCCTNLKRLELDYLYIDQEQYFDLPFLKNFESLKELKVKVVKGTICNIATFFNLYPMKALSKLELTNPSNETLVSMTKSLQNLESFKVFDYQANLKEWGLIQFLKNNINLKHLHLNFLNSVKIDMDVILYKICEFNLNLNSVSIIGARKISFDGLNYFFNKFSNKLKFIQLNYLGLTLDE
ncbi:hypothetical protein HK099_001614, partial [Clydaea vesicula]